MVRREKYGNYFFLYVNKIYFKMSQKLYKHNILVVLTYIIFIRN